MSTKNEIVEAIALQTNLSKTNVRLVLDAMGSVAGDLLQKDGTVTLPGIGKLKVANKAARTGRNPRTGETVQIPAKTVVKFSASKAIEDRVAI